MSYTIYVETLNGNQLTFRKVEDYELKDGVVIFVDSKTGLEKVFAKYQIEEEADI
jgi:hypothetical protein